MPRRLSRLTIPLVLLLTILQLAACNIPDRAAPAEPMEEPVVEDLTAVVNQDANVRTGPATDYAVAYWLTAGTEVTVVGRNANGDWLQIEHQDRPGWIFAALLDSATETAAMPEPGPTPVATPEPTPESTPEPTPEPESQTETPDRVVATVTGSVVNLRRGPGTDHAIDGQVRAGDPLHVTGRNADGSWLQVVHPAAPGEHVWIHGPLTDINADTIQTLTVAEMVEGVSMPEPATPTPVPAVEPDPESTVATLSDPSDCEQWHTVNANETRLEQITNWYKLDLALVETINGIDAGEPLTTGAQLCLRTSTIDTTLAQAAEPATETTVDPATPPPSPPAGCPACPSLPDFPERGHPNAPIGQKVVDSPLNVLWHAPGTYPRDLSGLDYDFELVFTDNSTMWNWSVRDFEACYDAVRVHMAEVASEINLQKLEVQLHDPIGSHGYSWRWGDREYGNVYQSPWTTGSGMDHDAWPNWNPTHPDVGLVSLACDYLPPTGRIICDIVPGWGNSHSIHLNAAATLALANSIAVASDNAREYRHNRLDQRIIDFNAYLFPILDNRRGDPAGQGPCLDVTRAR